MGNTGSGDRRTKKDREQRTTQRAEATIQRLDEIESIQRAQIEKGVRTEEDLQNVQVLHRVAELTGRGGSTFVKDDYVAILSTLTVLSGADQVDVPGMQKMTAAELINAIRIFVYSPEILLRMKQQRDHNAATRGIEAAPPPSSASNISTTAVVPITTQIRQRDTRLSKFK